MSYKYSDIIDILKIIPAKNKSALLQCILDISLNMTWDDQKNSQYVNENWADFIHKFHKDLYQPDPNLRSSVPWEVLQEDEILIDIEKLAGLTITDEEISQLKKNYSTL